MTIIKEYVSDIASQMGIKLSKVSLTGGLDVACHDYRLLIASKNHEVSTLLNQAELDSLQKHSSSGFLELKIKTALERLKIMLQA